MIKFTHDAKNINRDCEEFIETTEGDRYCKCEEIEKALAAIDDSPMLEECKGCFNYGKSTRIVSLPKPKRRKKNKKSKEDKEIDKAIRNIERMDERAKSSRVQTLGKRK